jgi:hypothetical protein
MGKISIFELSTRYGKTLLGNLSIFQKLIHHQGVNTSRGFLEVFFCYISPPTVSQSEPFVFIWRNAR